MVTAERVDLQELPIKPQEFQWDLEIENLGDKGRKHIQEAVDILNKDTILRDIDDYRSVAEYMASVGISPEPLLTIFDRQKPSIRSSYRGTILSLMRDSAAAVQEAGQSDPYLFTYIVEGQLHRKEDPNPTIEALQEFTEELSKQEEADPKYSFMELAKSLFFSW